MVSDSRFRPSAGLTVDAGELNAAPPAMRRLPTSTGAPRNETSRMLRFMCPSCHPGAAPGGQWAQRLANRAPQRTQSLDHRAEGGGGEVDLLVGSGPPDGEAQAAVGVHTHGG